MPYGGKYQMTPSQGMAAKLPTIPRHSEDVTIMTHGFDPYISEASPYHGGLFAVLDSLTKLICMGGNLRQAWMSFQEYFPKLTDADSWAKPFCALLGALKAEKELEVAAVGGKDSMSGTYEGISVPPTLISFVLGLSNLSRIITPEWKEAGNVLVWLRPEMSKALIPDFDSYKRNMEKIEEWNQEGMIRSAYAVGRGGLFMAMVKMAVGNRIGGEVFLSSSEDFFSARYGSVLLEMKPEWQVKDGLEFPSAKVIGNTFKDPAFSLHIGEETLDLSLAEVEKKWTQPLEEVFSLRGQPNGGQEEPPIVAYNRRSQVRPISKVRRPTVLIPVFPGTNCEVDSMAAFEKAGGIPKIQVFRNLTNMDVEQSLKELAKNISETHILMIPGGFSGGD
jgi:phosphoribosylformylglycinamidine synthase